MEPAPAKAPGRPRDRRARPASSMREKAIQVFFGGNAFVAVVVLALITLFLLREGVGFFAQNLRSVRAYRACGLEYVDIIREQADAHAALTRSLNQVRARETRSMKLAGKSETYVQNDVAALDRLAEEFSDAGTELSGLVSDLSDQAVAIRDRFFGSPDRAKSEAIPEVDEVSQSGELATQVAALKSAAAAYDEIRANVAGRLATLLQSAPQLADPDAQRALDRWKASVRNYLGAFDGQAKRLREWDSRKPVPWSRSVNSFLFGREWITASFWQDWYGIIPLLAGSLMVSAVALTIAVPLGVASAIYISEIAGRAEQNFIKPYIEFIAAIPSVVLGFFGIAVVGQAIRTASQSSWLEWVPFFPITERLNVFTAGALLALMAVPTIFTLSEDALRNVPRGFKEASYALGANRLQTIGRVLIPASLSGIISAILLGFGRVIGETMVVLLCAGNRIAIPDFTQGLGAFFQPVHTMTGIIAQEMGEVVRGSIHYRALFMVGLCLFAVTLAINYTAQRIAHRYRMSIG